MQKLKEKQKLKLQKYTQSINKKIEELQAKNLYEFVLRELPFVDDYHIEYRSNTDRVSKAEDLGDILLSGFQDLVNIVIEDGFGIKEYSTTNEEEAKLQLFRQKLEKHYPAYIEFDVSASINKNIKKLEKKEKMETLYYKELKRLDREIAKIRKVTELSFQVQRLTESLEWKFLKIIRAVELTNIEKIPVYEDIQRLEKEAREICDELVAKAKEYDSGIEKLVLFEV